MKDLILIFSLVVIFISMIDNIMELLNFHERQAKKEYRPGWIFLDILLCFGMFTGLGLILLGVI